MIDSDHGVHEKIQAISNRKKILTSLLAGSLAGAAAKTTIAPLDRAKINFQVQKNRFNYRALYEFMRRDYAMNGARYMWRGNSANMIRVMPSAAINFTSHEQYKRLLNVDRDNTNTPFRRFLAGSLAGLTANLTTYPMDLARARMAVTNKNQFKNIVHIFVKTYQIEGVRGMYHGVWPSMVGALPYAGVAYYVYETFKLTHKKKNQREPNPTERMIYGAIAGAAGQTSSYPFDVVRRRMQTAYILNRDEYNMGSVRLFEKIVRQEGVIRGLYKGLSMNWIKGPVAAGVGFATFDILQAFIRNHT